MFSGRLTHATIRILDWIAGKTLPIEDLPDHLRTGRRGEEAAYFYLRKLGYVMVARNFRSPNRRGEIDLIAWHKDVLCFVEVKTRTTHDVKPAEAAVDRTSATTFSRSPGNICATSRRRSGGSKSSACIMISGQTSRRLSYSRTFPPWRKMFLFVATARVGKD